MVIIKVKECALSWLRKALSSSVGKKYAMAITGLLLCGFLVVHLLGNLLLYVGEDAYNNYAHTLHKQEALIKIAEFGLAVLFLAHVALAFATSRQNRAAREVVYQVKETKQDEHVFWDAIRPQNTMVVSGLIVLAFLILHLRDFTFEWRSDIEGAEPFDKAVVNLRSGLSSIVF